MNARPEARCALLVSKDPLLLAVRSHVLREGGWTVHSASDDPEALVAVWKHNCHVVVLCHTLDPAEQADLDRRLRAIHPEIEIIRLGHDTDPNPTLLLAAVERAIE